VSETSHAQSKGIPFGLTGPIKRIHDIEEDLAIQVTIASTKVKLGILDALDATRSFIVFFNYSTI
jgi:hypothetical protein